MRRRLLNLLTALSLLLCIAVVVLWVRSYWVADALDLLGSGHVRTVKSSNGHLAFVEALRWVGGGAGNKTTGGIRYVAGEAGPLTRQPLGFAWSWRRPVQPPPRGGYSIRSALIVPHWLVAAATAAPPVAWLAYARQRNRRARGGRCVACGYDLRATPGRCPECGRGGKHDG